MATTTEVSVLLPYELADGTRLEDAHTCEMFFHAQGLNYADARALGDLIENASTCEAGNRLEGALQELRAYELECDAMRDAMWQLVQEVEAIVEKLWDGPRGITKDKAGMALKNAVRTYWYGSEVF